MSWSNDYLDIPFRDRGRDKTGVDCWGLVAMVQREQFGVELESGDDLYQSCDDCEHIESLVHASPQRDEWRRITPGAEKDGDIIALRLQGRMSHFGVICGTGRFLHILKTKNVMVERYDSLLWRNRVIGIFRRRESAT